MAEIYPRRFKDVLHLEFEDIRIAEDISMDPEDAGLFAIVDHAIDARELYRRRPAFLRSRFYRFHFPALRILAREA
jgi:hypothetical protein